MLKKTILIADNDRDLLKIEENFLIHAGYSVLCAQDAYQALRHVLFGSPNLLLLDINMPAGSGLHVHQRVRQRKASGEIPVIYLTGERTEGIKRAARNMGAFALMYKPFDFDDLLANVKTALGETNMHRSSPRHASGHAPRMLWFVPPKKS